MRRRQFFVATAALPGAAAVAQRPVAPLRTKILRWSFPAAETGFDPAQVSDLYSYTVIANIFDAPLQYDYLARPVRLRTKTAADLPEISADYRVFTVRIQPGIYFADDPAFHGKRRELTAADHVYQFKRVFDPRWKSPLYSYIAKTKPLGLDELRKQALATGRFDYDREVEGARLLDRYTFQIRLAEPDPRFAYNFTDARLFGAVAREVVETYGNDIMAHPVGTGPYRLVQWRRASFIALERNPGYREEFYQADPPADDARSQAIARIMRGKRLPLIDRVEITIIEDTQPQWLSFLNGSLDLGSPGEFLNLAAPGGQLAPHLAKRGIVLDRLISPDIIVTYFNMEDEVVGGYTPEKVALRRAIALAYNIDEEIRLLRRGQMLAAQSPVPPDTFGYEPDFVSEMSAFDRARAKALLDAFGYVDRNGDGWRELPDGRPLHLKYATQSDQFSRQANELWKKSMDAIGVRISFEVNQWPEQLKQARAGKLQMWGLGWSASAPDGETFFELAYGPAKGGANLARFDLPRYNALFERQRSLPDGPQRLALMREMKRLLVAYMPYKFHGHRFVNSLAQPWVIGFRRHPYARDFFKYLDIDVEQQARAAG
ncbi:MAG: ABC transporter substrate-binding protein [Sutterellaceae bacterium]|nr:ABC transporter substrate-binding protein [Burkholderiaceae bacterium]MCX7902036.1 ABC transporter substrate-binding protein [Burkholderiaceae bacterium]MDW8429677.1 ABC transporter substrate-binding protein [Sutterellaceae bacterium]